jgi:DNA-binding response OmpR family regulator
MKIHSVLIIDDEIDICMLLSKFLKRKEAQVDYATTLKDGMDKFMELHPQLLIIDHNLSDGQGIDTIMHFKKEKKDLLVIVISAMANLKQYALDNGADYFIEKPITFTTLNSLIEAA